MTACRPQAPARGSYEAGEPNNCQLVKVYAVHHMSYSLNSLKGGYIGDYTGDYYRGY